MLGLSENGLYEAYLCEMNRVGLDVNDFYKFFSIDARNNQGIYKAQLSFLNEAKKQGLTESEARNLIENLEKKRMSRIFSQAITLIRIEYGSERLAQALIKFTKKKGFTKGDAVTIAGMREGRTILGAEYLISDYNISIYDFILAITLGAGLSRYF